MVRLVLRYRNQLYYEFGNNYADAGGYKPNYYKGITNVDGVLRVYLFIDALVSGGALTWRRWQCRCPDFDQYFYHDSF